MEKREFVEAGCTLAQKLYGSVVWDKTGTKAVAIKDGECSFNTAEVALLQTVNELYHCLAQRTKGKRGN